MFKKIMLASSLVFLVSSRQIVAPPDPVLACCIVTCVGSLGFAALYQIIVVDTCKEYEKNQRDTNEFVQQLKNIQNQRIKKMQ